MNPTTMEITGMLNRDGLADVIWNRWDVWNNQRAGWIAEKEELRNFLFATDTSHTVHNDGSIPWKNRTTLPKLCQIRDNLHANYISSLFPNDDWLKWEGYTLKDEEIQKRNAIQAYMSNKTREGGMRHTASKLLYDYIDYGIAIADIKWCDERKTDPQTGEVIQGYVGPKLVRVSPHDIVFDPTAVTFEQSPKITRSLMRFGELKLMAMSDNSDWIQETIQHAEITRSKIGSYKKDDFNKAAGYTVDGFGNLYEYYQSGYVEVLEFEGTLHDPDSGELLDDHIITVIDRQLVVRKEPIPAWKRGGHKVFTAWRKRPDNLYGMGPLDNLVGMQYRIDHLENAKADAWDLVVTPMFKIIGDVDEFEFYPGGEVHIAEGGDVQPLVVPAQALQVNNEIGVLMQMMEEFAGAPKQAMGIRTPGEKTAFEVQALENAAGRIFQEKITQFEMELLEPALNNMLEMAVRNMNGADILRVMDDDLGVAQFLSITKEDITAKGKLRPIGARHFAQRSQLMQNLTGIANTNVWPKIERHMSDKSLAKLVEDALQLQRFSLVSDNAGLFDQAESQRLMNQLQEDVETEAMTPIEGEEPPV